MSASLVGHGRHERLGRPRRAARRLAPRTAAAGVGVLSAVAAALDPTLPRYERTLYVVWGSLCLLAAVTPTGHRRLAASFVAVVATVELAMAGVVTGLSVDEAFGLIAFGLLTYAIGAPLAVLDRRARLRALAAERQGELAWRHEVGRALARLERSAGSPPTCK